MFKKLRGIFSNDLSIDLGTANTLIYVKEDRTPNAYRAGAQFEFEVAS